MHNLACLKKWILNHYGLSVTIILIIALLLRICMLGIGGYSSDSAGYYTAAINIVNGNGYSLCTEKPFYPFYFREPLTSYSMAFVIWISNLFLKVDYIDYPSTLVITDMQPYHQYFLFYIRLFSVLLQLFSIYLFFLTLRKKSNDMFAIVFLLICALYLPLIVHTSLVLREPYVFFLLSVISYLWCKYLDNRNCIYMAVIALINGFLCLFLQIYWLLAIFIFFFMFWVLHKEIVVFFKHCILYFVFFSLPIIPHIYKVYQYYPDIRIIKTLGTALTYECVSGYDAYRAFGISPWSAKDGDLPNGMITHSEYFDPHNAAELFKCSFNGTFQTEAERLNDANTKERIWGYKLDKVLQCFRNTIFMVGITYDYGALKGRFSKKDILKFFIVLPSLLFGVFGLIGFFPFLQKYWLSVPVLIYHSFFFFVYGDEERRQVMLVPYLICIVMLLIWKMIKSKKQYFECVFADKLHIFC